MRDEMDARMWEAHGARFTDDLHNLLRGVMVTFCRMAAINFAAPWRKRAGNC